MAKQWLTSKFKINILEPNYRLFNKLLSVHFWLFWHFLTVISHIPVLLLSHTSLFSNFMLLCPSTLKLLPVGCCHELEVSSFSSCTYPFFPHHLVKLKCNLHLMVESVISRGLYTFPFIYPQRKATGTAILERGTRATQLSCYSWRNPLMKKVHLQTS